MRQQLEFFLRSKRGRRGFLISCAVVTCLLVMFWDDLVEKRVAVVVPGKIVRGAWQRPGPLRRILAREGIKTIVTLTAINDDDPKYVDQARVVRETGVRWIIVPMRGSKATNAQMAEAADLLADPTLQPVFFHCVAGHHRSSQTHAAYCIRHEGMTARAAWTEVSRLPWARPDSDRDDHRLIETFAQSNYARRNGELDGDGNGNGTPPMPQSLEMDHPRVVAGGNSPGELRRLEFPDGELRNRHTR